MDPKIQGKKNRAAGQRFESHVRKDLESKGWIVDRWTNNVELSMDYDTNEFPFDRAKLIKAKSTQYNRGTTGFPDFIAFKKSEKYEEISRYRSVTPLITIGRQNCINDIDNEIGIIYEVMGVEVKSNGYLDKIEKAKCKWLLDNNIFSKILIAKKGKKRGEIIYEDFMERTSL